MGASVQFLHFSVTFDRKPVFTFNIMSLQLFSFRQIAVLSCTLVQFLQKIHQLYYNLHKVLTIYNYIGIILKTKEITDMNKEKQLTLEEEFNLAQGNESHELKNMEVGDYIEMDKKHQRYVHTYGCKMKKKFSTRSVNGRLIVKRIY